MLVTRLQGNITIYTFNMHFSNTFISFDHLKSLFKEPFLKNRCCQQRLGQRNKTLNDVLSFVLPTKKLSSEKRDR